VTFWRYIKMQRCADSPALFRYCYEIGPEIYVGVRVGMN
jgi:hypothetical protein